jgi:carbonic anhydrase
MNNLPEEWIDAILEILSVHPTSKQDLEEWTAWLNQLDKENQNDRLRMLSRTDFFQSRWCFG